MILWTRVRFSPSPPSFSLIISNTYGFLDVCPAEPYINCMRYKKVKELLETEKAYLAGMIDGEGTVTLVKHRSRDTFKRPQVAVSSTSYSLLKAFVNMTGVGYISQKKKYKDHHKQSYHWNISSGSQTIDLCKQLLPYLREDKKWKRAKKLVSEWKSVTKRNGKYTQPQRERKLQFEKEFFSI